MRFTCLENASRLPLSRIQFCTRCILRISGASLRSVRSHFLQLSVEKEFIGSESRTSEPCTFFLSEKQLILEYLLLRPRAEVASHLQHVEIGNNSLECICFRTCNHDTRDDVENHTTIFASCPQETVAGLALRDCSNFLHQPISSLSVLMSALARGENYIHLSTSFQIVLTVSRGIRVENYKRLFVNKTQLPSAENILQSSARCKIFSPSSLNCEPLRKLLLGNSRSGSEILFSQEFCTCICKER